MPGGQSIPSQLSRNHNLWDILMLSLALLNLILNPWSFYYVSSWSWDLISLTLRSTHLFSSPSHFHEISFIGYRLDNNLSIARPWICRCPWFGFIMLYHRTQFKWGKSKEKQFAGMKWHATLCSVNKISKASHSFMSLDLNTVFAKLTNTMDPKCF